MGRKRVEKKRVEKKSPSCRNGTAGDVVGRGGRVSCGGSYYARASNFDLSATHNPVGRRLGAAENEGFFGCDGGSPFASKSPPPYDARVRANSPTNPNFAFRT